MIRKATMTNSVIRNRSQSGEFVTYLTGIDRDAYSGLQFLKKISMTKYDINSSIFSQRSHFNR